MASPGNSAFIWTDEAVATLKDHWNSGLSCSQIAAAMGRGLTRNSIIGKVHRLKLPKRSTNISKAQRSTLGRNGASAMRASRKPRGSAAASQSKPPAVRSKQVLPPTFEPEPFDAETDVGVDATNLVGLLQLNDTTCKWPVGDPLLPGFGFCGQPKHRDAGPYCPHHTARSVKR